MKPLVPVLLTVMGNVSDCPTATSPNRKVVGLKDNWVAAAAGVEKQAVKRKALSDRKNAYLYSVWGRVITLSVCRWGSDQ